MATVTKDFKIKYGLVVEGTTATVNNFSILTKSTADQEYIVGLIGGTATSANTINTVVKRDGSGNFAAGTITAALTGNVTGNLTGNASTATTLATPRTIAGQSFDGSANISIAPTNLTGVTATAAEINILAGTAVSATELNYVDGVTSAIQTQLNAKAAGSDLTTHTGATEAHGATGAVVGTTNTQTLTNKTLTSPVINTPTGITKSDVGLANVDNTSDTNKPVSSATQTALDLKAPLASPTFTGTVSGVTKSHVGLGNVDNTSDVNKPVSTATQNALDAKLATAGGTMSGAIAMGTNKITGLGEPTSAQDAATKNYVDTTVQGIDWKASVRAATTANVTLASDLENGDTLDGIVLSTGDRVLVKDQSTGSQNGIYVVKVSGAPDRSTDADSGAEVTANFAVFVEEGTANADSGFTLTNNGTVTIGTTALAFTQFTGLGQIVAGTGLDKTGNTLDIDSTVVTLTGTQTLTNKTLTSPVINTPTGITKSDVGLGNVDNTSDANKPVSTAIQTALDLKAPLASPALTGTPTAPTAAADTNTTQVATTAFAKAEADAAQTAAIAYADALTTADVAENTNLYYTAARAKAEAATLLANATKTNITITKDGSDNLTISAENGVADSTTTDLAEGTNLYHTSARAKTAAAELLTGATLSNITITGTGAGLVITAENGVADSTTTNLAEGTNLYFTDARARTAVDGTARSFTTVEINSLAKQVAATLVVATASASNVAHSFAKTSYRSAEYLVKVAYGTHTEISKVLITLDTSDNIAITEYGTIGTNGSASTISAGISGANVQLLVTTANNNSTVTVMGTLIV